MNLLGIDYGTKRIGLAVSINGIINPLSVIPNNSAVFPHLRQLIADYQIHKVYVGMSQGRIADVTTEFVDKLTNMLKLPVETIDESFSTIEAEAIYKQNSGKKKKYHRHIDAVSAAVILNRLSI